ncbi:MAG: hypothetical protein U9Q78_09410 [Chloroflexota bacterium]|nr:hypothetical protein [Chloroflexota bacterium]
MKNLKHPHLYPRRRLIRSVLRKLACAAFAVLTDLRIIGQGTEVYPWD